MKFLQASKFFDFTREKGAVFVNHCVRKLVYTN